MLVYLLCPSLVLTTALCSSILLSTLVPLWVNISYKVFIRLLKKVLVIFRFQNFGVCPVCIVHFLYCQEVLIGNLQRTVSPEKFERSPLQDKEWNGHWHYGIVKVGQDPQKLSQLKIKSIFVWFIKVIIWSSYTLKKNTIISIRGDTIRLT